MLYTLLNFVYPLSSLSVAVYSLSLYSLYSLYTLYSPSPLSLSPMSPSLSGGSRVHGLAILAGCRALYDSIQH